MNGKRIILTLIIVVLLDCIWFSVALRSLYRPIYQRFHCKNREDKSKKDIRKRFIRYVPAFLTWVLISIGLDYFVLSPSLSQFHMEMIPQNPLEIPQNTKTQFYGDLIKRAVLFGFILYGVFNGTNYATLEHYPIGLVILDTVWGMTLTTMTVILVVYPYLLKRDEMYIENV